MYKLNARLVSTRDGDQLFYIVTHVFGPGCHQPVEALAVPAVECPQGLLETGEVARHCGHKPVNGFLGPSCAVLSMARSLGLINQPPQRGRSSTGLFVQPVPLAGKQRYLARNHSQLRTPRTAFRWTSGHRGAGLFRAGDAFGNLVGRPSEIDLDKLPREIIEDQHRLMLASISHRLDPSRHLG